MTFTIFKLSGNVLLTQVWCIINFSGSTNASFMSFNNLVESPVSLPIGHFGEAGISVIFGCHAANLANCRLPASPASVTACTLKQQVYITAIMLLWVLVLNTSMNLLDTFIIVYFLYL